MKTLIIVAHPNVGESSTQQFFKTTSDYLADCEWYEINDQLGTAIDVEKEQRYLSQFERIILEFPFYWYSAPASLKYYLDEVLTRKFVVANNSLAEKELGLVVSIGDSLKEYQAGQKQHYTMSELLRPFEALANKAQMKYLPPLVVAQFAYLQPADKQKLVVDYLQYLSMSLPTSLNNQAKWYQEQLLRLNNEQPTASGELIIETIADRQSRIEDLKDNLKLIKDDEE